jgi:hypothetical protein
MSLALKRKYSFWLSAMKVNAKLDRQNYDDNLHFIGTLNILILSNFRHCLGLLAYLLIFMSSFVAAGRKLIFVILGEHLTKMGRPCEFRWWEILIPFKAWSG